MEQNTVTNKMLENILLLAKISPGSALLMGSSSAICVVTTLAGVVNIIEPHPLVLLPTAMCLMGFYGAIKANRAVYDGVLEKIRTHGLDITVRNPTSRPYAKIHMEHCGRPEEYHAAIERCDVWKNYRR